MAEPQEIPQPNPEHEAILQRAPYLQAFLNHPSEIGVNWLDELQPVAEPIEREIAQKLGDEWWTTTLVPITVMAKEQNVFDQKIGLYDMSNKKRKPEQMLLEIGRSLFLIGYEVGNKRDAFSFMTPIIGKLSQSGLFHYPVPEEEKKSYPQRVTDTVWGMIQSGVFIRFYNDRENKSSGTPLNLDDFRDFIEGLESIDQLPPKDIEDSY